MLGWFKNKLKKKDTAEAQEPVDQGTAEPTVVEEPQEAAPVQPIEQPLESAETPASPEPVAETAAAEVAAAIVADEIITEDIEVVEPVIELQENEDIPPFEPPTVEETLEDTSAQDDEVEPEEETETVADSAETTTIDEKPSAEQQEEQKVETLQQELLRPKTQYQQPAEKPSMSKRTYGARTRDTSTPRGLFTRLSKRLSQTRESFTYQMDALFLGKKEIDTSLLDDLEEILILADLGTTTTQDLLEHARRRVKRKELRDPEALHQLLKDKISEYIVSNDQDATLVVPDKGPFVIMVIGVNGVGKTTTIGKIAKKFVNAGSSVMLIAADTFRAAAIAQLQIWGERNNVPVIAHKEGSDPSSVVYDGIGAALDKKVDVVLVDTAGRLHTKANLMEELKKIKRVMNKRLPGAPHETLLVIDATTGQNGVSQAKLFNEAVEVTGIALTKLDGTSKGGIVANICKELKIPIRFIGIGEQVDDLRDFDSGEFVDALFQSRSNND